MNFYSKFFENSNKLNTFHNTNLFTKQTLPVKQPNNKFKLKLFIFNSLHFDLHLSQNLPFIQLFPIQMFKLVLIRDDMNTNQSSSL